MLARKSKLEVAEAVRCSRQHLFKVASQQVPIDRQAGNPD